MDEDVERAIADLDHEADPLRADPTPAAIVLASLGLRAVAPLAGPLLSDSQESRVHAQRAWEAIVYARHGFRAGQGFPDADAEREAVADLSEVGYAFDDGPPEREASVERLRGWLGRASE
jgi:hypothetical protein